MERKITKKEFCNALENNRSIFFGCLRREATTDEIMLAVDNFKKEAGIIEERTAKAHPTYIEFSGGSRLLLNQAGKHSFYELVYNGFRVLSCIRESVDCYGDNDIHAMYYLIQA